MHITFIRIVNFKGLKDIEFSINTPGSVIVGPNAVGKTTIFEAIRLHKAALYPSINNEFQQVINSLKANTTQLNQILISAIANDITKAIEITLAFKISEAEVIKVEKSIQRFAILHLQNTNRLPNANIPFSEIHFLSNPLGQQIFSKGQDEISEFINRLRENKSMRLSLFIQPTGIVRGNTLLEQEFLTILNSSLNYTETYFNYFPADRSLPMGDQQIQIGQGLATQQLNSYIINPQQKYQFMKSFIINMFLMGKLFEKKIADHFNLIFENLLPGKKLLGINLTANGGISITITDSLKGTNYDIDNMSSGEKNLVLTLMFMSMTTHLDGIIIFDEPELHLNPTLLKKLLDFIMDDLFKLSRFQIILNTHSAEILATAFQREDTTLFHLIGPSEISPILHQDKMQVYDALQKLGVSTPEILSTKGVIYVEGIDDVAILETTLIDLFSGFQLKHLKGRQEIEKTITFLQSEEKKDQLDSYQYFIFDNDNDKINISSTDKVKVLQWDRYCLENYLIDNDAIFEIIEEKKGNDSSLNRGAIQKKIKELAFSQIEKNAIINLLKEYKTESFSPKYNSLIKSSLEDTYATIKENFEGLDNRLKTILNKLDLETFKKNIDKYKSEMTEDWDLNWINRCDGKKLLSDIHKFYSIPVTLIELKKRIFTLIKIKKSEPWVLIEAKLKNLI